MNGSGDRRSATGGIGARLGAFHGDEFDSVTIAPATHEFPTQARFQGISDTVSLAKKLFERSPLQRAASFAITVSP